VPFDPNSIQPGNIPGIPSNIPKYMGPPAAAQPITKEAKKDVDDDDPNN
jgi:hypothetical protein